MDKGLELEGLSTINKSDIEVAKGGARSRLLEGMTLSNRDLLHSALMGSDNRAIPALGRAVKLTPGAADDGDEREGARSSGSRTRASTSRRGSRPGNVSTPREIIAMLREVIAHPVLGPITRRAEYDAHPVGKPPIHYNNTDHPAARGNVQVLGGKTGYNDDARYCLVVATKIDGRVYYMAFLGDDGKMTRFGDVARVADWIVSHPQKLPPPFKPAPPVPFAPPPEQELVAAGSAAPASPPAPAAAAAPSKLPVPVVPRSAQEPIAAGPTTPPPPLPVDVAAPATGGGCAAVHGRLDAVSPRHALTSAARERPATSVSLRSDADRLRPGLVARAIGDDRAEVAVAQTPQREACRAPLRRGDDPASRADEGEAMAAGRARVDLDGERVGVVLDAREQHAGRRVEVAARERVADRGRVLARPHHHEAAIAGEHGLTPGRAPRARRSSGGRRRWRFRTRSRRR